MKTLKIDTEFITLGQFLKAAMSFNLVEWQNGF